MKFQKQVRIGVLALQGAFQLTKPHIDSLGAEFVPVLNKDDLENIDGLILPGGESSTMLKLIDLVGVKDHLLKFFKFHPGLGNLCWCYFRWRTKFTDLNKSRSEP